MLKTLLVVLLTLGIFTAVAWAANGEIPPVDFPKIVLVVLGLFGIIAPILLQAIGFGNLPGPAKTVMVYAGGFIITLVALSVSGKLTAMNATVLWPTFMAWQEFVLHAIIKPIAGKLNGR